MPYDQMPNFYDREMTSSNLMVQQN